MKITVRHVVLLLLIAFLICVTLIRLIPFETLKEYADTLSADGNFESFGRKSFEILSRNSLLAIISSGFLIAFTSLSPFSLLDVIVFEKINIQRIGMSRTSRSSYIGVLLFSILLGLVIRVFLLFEPVTYDEAFTVNQYVSRSWMSIVSNYNYPNNHVLHSLTAKVFCSVRGYEIWIIRLPALIFGVLCIPVLFKIERLLWKNEMHVPLAGLLFAISPILIEYSAMARGYSMMWFFALLTAYQALLFYRKNEVKHLWWMSFFSALAFWIIPVAIFPVGIIYAILLFSMKRHEIFHSMGIGMVLTALLYAPIWLWNGFDPILAPSVNGTESLSRLFEYHLFHGAKDFFQNYIMTKGLIFSVSFSLFLWFLYKNRGSRKLVFLAIIILILLLVSAKSIPPSRTWTGLLILLLPLISYSWNNLFQSLKNALLLVLIPFFIVLIQFSVSKSSIFIMSEFRYGSAEKSISYLKTTDLHLPVLGDFPNEAPLEYYASLSGYDVVRPLFLPDQFILVINADIGQNLAVVQLHLKLPENLYSFATYHQQNGYEVYLVSRKP